MEQQVSLSDIYALINDMQLDIETKYDLIEEKVDALEKNRQEKFATFEKKMTEKMKVNIKRNAKILKKTSRLNLEAEARGKSQFR